jgi:hypothetical protein
MKIRPVGAELFHADRRTDMTNLIAAFRSFANVPIKQPDTSASRSESELMCLPTWNNTGPTGRIFMKFEFVVFF